MPDYTIYVLGESEMTISGGEQLDGVNQGDGSHLVGETITLNSTAWLPVDVTDTDTDFRDNDGSQRLNGAQTIDGVLYADNTQVEAEFGLTLTDGTNTWQVVGFNVNNSNPSFGTIEGLAFIGGTGGFPPVGVPLTVSGAQEGPDYETTEYATPICYVAGTLIDTGLGPRPVETLSPGETVWTADAGYQPVRWVGQRTMLARGRHAPVRIPAGILGATRPLSLSRAHRMLVSSPVADLLFGEPEVLVAATHLAEAGFAHDVPGRLVTYCHLALDHHAVIRANGALSESLCIGQDDAQPGLRQSQFFADLAETGLPVQIPARRCLRRHEAMLVLQDVSNIEPESRISHSV